jgi:hypothetical protein
LGGLSGSGGVSSDVGNNWRSRRWWGYIRVSIDALATDEGASLTLINCLGLIGTIRVNPRDSKILENTWGGINTSPLIDICLELVVSSLVL